MRRRHGPGGWRRRGGRRPRRSPAGRDSSSRPPDRSANQFALAKCGENSRFAKAMRSEGDESGIAYWKRKGRVIFKEEMKSSARAGWDVILSTQRMLRGPRGGFYLHKECCAAGIGFYLHKEFVKKHHEKLMIYSKTFPRCARQLVKNCQREIMKNQWGM